MIKKKYGLVAAIWLLFFLAWLYQGVLQGALDVSELPLKVLYVLLNGLMLILAFHKKLAVSYVLLIALLLGQYYLGISLESSFIINSAKGFLFILTSPLLIFLIIPLVRLFSYFDANK